MVSLTKQTLLLFGPPTALQWGDGVSNAREAAREPGFFDDLDTWDLDTITGSHPVFIDHRFSAQRALRYMKFVRLLRTSFLPSFGRSSVVHSGLWCLLVCLCLCLREVRSFVTNFLPSFVCPVRGALCTLVLGTACWFACVCVCVGESNRHVWTLTFAFYPCVLWLLLLSLLLLSFFCLLNEYLHTC